MKRWVLAFVFSESDDPRFHQDVESVLASLKTSAGKSRRSQSAIEYTLDLESQDELPLRTQLKSLLAHRQIDFCLLPEEDRSDKGLVVFDMDSTLIRQEVIDELARVHGIGEKVSAITERAMRGELNFDQSLTERVSLLKGLKEHQLIDVYKRLGLSPGAEILVSTLKAKGFKTAIVSGGFKFFANNFKELLGMDHVFANELEFQDGILTGRVRGDIVNAQRKADLLLELAASYNLKPHNVIAVGDGANDIPMLKAAGLGVAYHAKARVRESVCHEINHGPLSTLLYYLGLT